LVIATGTIMCRYAPSRNAHFARLLVVLLAAGIGLGLAHDESRPACAGSAPVLLPEVIVTAPRL